MISKNDLGELKRIATNTYDDDKRFVLRVLTEIANMERELLTLRAENANLKKAAQSPVSPE